MLLWYDAILYMLLRYDDILYMLLLYDAIIFKKSSDTDRVFLQKNIQTFPLALATQVGPGLIAHKCLLETAAVLMVNSC